MPTCLVFKIMAGLGFESSVPRYYLARALDVGPTDDGMVVSKKNAMLGIDVNRSESQGPYRQRDGRSGLTSVWQQDRGPARSAGWH